MSTAPWGNDPYYMAGTEGTGEYRVVRVRDDGRIGVRQLLGGLWRVRLEPASREAAADMLERQPSLQIWKQPDDRQLRFSTVVDSEGELAWVIQVAESALLNHDATPTGQSPRLSVVLALIGAAGMALIVAWRRRRA